MNQPGRRPHLAIFAISGATLAYEIALTRLFAVAQWYHFAFMAVSLALLGFGASGSFLAIRPSLSRQTIKRPFWIAGAFAASLPVAYLIVNALPFDSHRIALEPQQFLWMALFFLTLAVPFFFAGVLLAAFLSGFPEAAGSLYASNLVGSAIGCLAAPLLLSWAGMPGAIFAAAAAGWLGAAVLAGGERPRALARLLIAAAGFVFSVILAVAPAKWMDIRMSPYKRLSLDLLYPKSHLLWTGWNAMSRVDVVETPLLRSAPGQSLNYLHSPPPQLGIYVDGDNPSPITADDGTLEAWTRHLPVALPFLLRPEAEALVLEPAGGMDVLVGLHNGARQIAAIESNPLILEVARDRFGNWGENPFHDGRVEAIAGSARGYARTSQRTFDLVLLSLSDAYQPVTSGSYSLTETYLLTRQAMAEFLSRLKPGGILAFQRWLQTPPSEGLRGVATALAALHDRGIADPRDHLIVFRSMQTLMTLVSNRPFSDDDIAAARAFCETRGFDLVHLPGMRPEEANRYNRLPAPIYYEAVQAMLAAPSPEDYTARYPYDISPPTDDHPFFFHFFRWSQAKAVLEMVGKVWLPFGGAGYFVLLFLLAVAVLASVLFILAPLGMRGRPQKGRGLPLLFLCFLSIGLAFLFVEIPLIQRFILYLGHPTYAFATVAGTLLLFSGLGSQCSHRIPPWSLLLLVGWVAACPLFLPAAISATLGWPFAMRVLMSILLLCVPGFLMGMPFAQGVRLSARLAPGWVPWLWAVNGSASVIASILAALLAVTFNFTAVLAVGAGAYFLTWLCMVHLYNRAGLAAEPGTSNRRM